MIEALIDVIDEEFEEAGAEFVVRAFSDRIYWPLAGSEWYEARKAQADAEQRQRVLEYIANRL